MNLKPFSFSFTDSQEKLDFPGFQVPEGNFALITGQNGSGKTTFLDRLRKSPDLICLDDEKVSCFYLEQLFDYLIFPYKPVWWNISLPKLISENISKEDAMLIANEQLADFSLALNINRYPASLSGGEKHLILIIRFALSHHNVLLLDEPTTSIDRERESIFWNILYQLIVKKKKKVIIASHTLPLNAKIQNQRVFRGIAKENLTIQNYLPNNINIENSKEALS